jgi:hypothetical protein
MREDYLHGTLPPPWHWQDLQAAADAFFGDNVHSNFYEPGAHADLPTLSKLITCRGADLFFQWAQPHITMRCAHLLLRDAEPHPDYLAATDVTRWRHQMFCLEDGMSLRTGHALQLAPGLAVCAALMVNFDNWRGDESLEQAWVVQGLANRGHPDPQYRWQIGYLCIHTESGKVAAFKPDFLEAIARALDPDADNPSPPSKKIPFIGPARYRRWEERTREAIRAQLVARGAPPINTADSAGALSLTQPTEAGALSLPKTETPLMPTEPTTPGKTPLETLDARLREVAQKYVGRVCDPATQYEIYQDICRVTGESLEDVLRPPITPAANES